MRLHKTTSILAILAIFFLGFASVATAGDGELKEGEAYDPTPNVMHHIADANQFPLIGSTYLPLPCIAYSSDGGLFFSMSSAFEYDQKAGCSKKAIGGYVIYHDQLMRVIGAGFPKEAVAITLGGHGDSGHGAHGHDDHGHGHEGDQTLSEEGLHSHDSHASAGGHGAHSISYNGKSYVLEAPSTVQGMTSWYDFSITKNVFTMLLGVLLLLFIFRGIAKKYKKKEGEAPSGLQSLLEPVFIFMRDEVIKPAIGPKWKRYFSFIMALFFFILINDLLGLIPFFPGSADVTGNIGVTLVLAIFTFIVTNISGNKHYWEHIIWMPGVPAWVKIILTPVEILGIFIKPATLFIRLFANITAGHIIILSLTSLIFVFKSTGDLGGVGGGLGIAIPFVFFMNFLEILVAFLQAFIFALLSALYIGAAVEEHHHEPEGEGAHH